MTRQTSKTQKILIDTARQLFAKKGIDNTTMNDIAESSGKGRRTLYTYFSNKSDVYKAVIESELEILYNILDIVISRKISADEKLLIFTFSRLNAIKEVVRRNGTLRADFFRDIWRVEKVRKEFDKKEIHYLEVIMNEGCKQGIFDVSCVPQAAEIMHYVLKGLEVPVIRGTLNLTFDSRDDRETVSSLLFKGLNIR